MIANLDKVLAAKWIPITLAILAVLLYAGTWGHGFVVDDTPAILENKLVNKGVSAIPEIWSNSFYYGYDERELANEYRPVSSSFFALEYSLFGKQASAYHFISTLLYGLLIWVLFRVLRAWGMQARLTFVVLLLFAFHPIHTEVVANIKSQDELLMCLFLMLGMWSWMNYLKSPNHLSLSLSLGLVFLSLFSKASALPLVVLLVPAASFLQDQIKNKAQWLFLIPIALFLVIRQQVLQGSPEITVANNALIYLESTGDRMAMSFDLFLRYLWQSIYPYPLSWDYSFNHIPLHGWASWRTWIGLPLFLTFPVFAVIYRNSKPLLSLGLMLFWFGILLYTQLFLLLEVTYAERFLFLPVLGILLVVMGSIPKSQLRFGAALVVAAVFAFITIDRASDWKSNETLYSADLPKVPHSIRANTALAYVLYEKSLGVTDDEMRKELLAKSNDLYVKAINTYGKDANTWFNYGMNNLATGEYNTAEQAFKQTVKLRPDHTSAYNNLGNIQYLKGEQGNAKQYYAMAVNTDETNAEAWSNLGAVYLLFRQNDSAFLALSKATQLNPEHENARYNLNVVKKRLGIQP